MQKFWKAALPALTWALISCPVGAATFLQYQMQPGYAAGALPLAGQGVLMAPDWNFQLSGGVGVFVTPTNPIVPGYWVFGAGPGSGPPLGLGSFSYESNSAQSPWFSLQDPNLACTVYSGNVTIRDLAVDASNNVTRLALDVVNYCAGSLGALAIGLRVNSDVPYSAPMLPAYSGRTFITWAQEGMYVSQADGGTVTPADGAFSVTPSADHNEIIGGMSGPGSSPFWRFAFTAPNHQALAPGIYENAVRAISSPASPGLDVSHASSGCDSVAGRFVVRELEMSGLYISKFAVDFEQHCDGDPAGLFGGLRYNSDVPYVMPQLHAVVNHLAIETPQSTVFATRSEVVGTSTFVTQDRNHQPFQGASFVVTTEPAGCANVLSPPTSGAIGVGQVTVQGLQSGACVVVVSMGDDALRFPFVFFDSSELALTPVPSGTLTTQTGKTFQVALKVTLHGNPVPGQNVYFSPNSVANGPSATVEEPVITGLDGVASANGIANNIQGQYTITAAIWERSLSIAVVQGNLPPPMTPFTETTSLQDMWWVGSSENGWGMSLIHHGDTLFAALYIYDANGHPTWLVMPGGSWDSTHFVYSGSLYAPSGSPFYAYDTTHFVAGSAKGPIKITFQDANDAIIDYTIGGVTGRKFVQREVFADGSATSPDHSDLWWGGMSQNGWGITIMQQGTTLFPIWYTYDANGAPVWYVMPGGTWTATDTYEGHLYRTTGSSWVGATYNPASLQVFDAGTFRFQFAGDSASFTYTADGHAATIPLVKEAF